MDTMTSDVSKPNEVMNLLELNASDDGQSDMASNLELINAALGNSENETTTLLESQSTIELNGERHVIVQETQDPQTGELLLVLKSESGNHIALPSSVIQSGIQLATENQLDTLHQEVEEQPAQEPQSEAPIDQNINTGSVVNGVPEDTETVGVPALESEVQQPEVTQDKLPAGTTVAIIDGGVTTQEAVDGQEMASSTVSLDAASLEALVANAMASGAMTSAADGQEFVIMTDGAAAVDAVNAAESLEVGGGDGGVYAEQVEQVVDNSSTQYVASNGSTEEMILNAMSQSGTLQDGQVIHAVVDNQTFAYTISATESGFQLIPMGPVVESPRSSPKKSSPVRSSKQRQSPGETLLVASARMDSMTSSGFKRKPGVGGRIGNKPNSYDNQRFMGRTPVIDSDSPSLLTATAPGPSQLASSRRTYSKKNVVWCNPESRSNKTTFVSMSNVPKTAPRNAEPSTSMVAVSQPSVQPSTVTSPLKVTSVPTPASPEKPKPVVRAASPEKIQVEKPKPVVRAASPEKIQVEKPKPVVRAASPEKIPQVEHPILIDDGKTLEEPASQVIETEVRPKSPAKKENGVTAKPAPKQPVEEVVPKKAVGRPRKSVGKVVDNHEAEATKKEELKSPKKTPEVTEEVAVVQEKERPSRARKPTPKVAAIASKTPSKVEEKVSVPEEPSPVQSEVEPSVAGKGTPARVGRKKVVKQEEGTPPRVGREKDVKQEEGTIEEKTEEVGKEKIGEKTPKRVEEKIVETKKEVEAQKAVSSEDEAGSSNVRRSSRPPKRKSIDDDIIVPERKVVSEKKSRVKEPEKNVEGKEREKIEEKKETEGSGTPRKRVGFSSEVTKSENSSQESKRRRSASTEKKSTPGKEESTPKKSEVKPILKRSPSSMPKGRRLETPIVATFSSIDSKAEKKLLKEVIDSLNDQRSPDQRYDIPTPGCEIHIRQQSVSLAGYTPRGSGSSYACQKCGFRTSRMNNLIIHHKEQCPVVKNAQMMSWKAEIRKQTKTPPTSTITRRTSELSPSSPEEEEGSPVPASSFTPYESPAATLARPSDIDAPLSADEEDEALSLENKIRDKYGFAPKDIVWVEWKNTSWPALAISVDIKKGEVQARLIDGPERSSRRG